MGQPTPRKVFLKLVEHGLHRRYRIARGDGRQIQAALHAGRPVPDICLPGRVVMRLSPGEREALGGLTAEMTQDRPEDFAEL